MVHNNGSFILRTICDWSKQFYIKCLRFASNFIPQQIHVVGVSTKSVLPSDSPGSLYLWEAYRCLGENPLIKTGQKPLKRDKNSVKYIARNADRRRWGVSVSILTPLALVPHVKVSFTVRSLLNLQLNKETYETNI